MIKRKSEDYNTHKLDELPLDMALKNNPKPKATQLPSPRGSKRRRKKEPLIGPED